MLAKQFLLQEKLQINYILRKGSHTVTDLFTIKYIASDKLQFCIVISKKLAAKAVDRNHLKRQISESIRLHLDKIKNTHQVVIIPKKHILKASYQDIEQNSLNLISFLNK